MGYYILWTAAIVIFCIAEAATWNLVTIWFALGAVGSLIAAALGASFLVQLAVFVLLAAALLLITRPLVKKHIRPREEKTNADRVIGKHGFVTEDISPEKFAGRVKVCGQEWSAVSTDGGYIHTGKTVEVVRIEGVKLIVREAESKKEG